jgi:hypothetical protein
MMLKRFALENDNLFLNIIQFITERSHRRSKKDKVMRRSPEHISFVRAFGLHCENKTLQDCTKMNPH